MEFKVAQIAEMLSATVEGNPDTIINTFCKIEEGVAGGLTFLANPKYTNYIYDTEASAVLVNQDFVPEKPVKATLIRTQNSYLAVAKLMEFYQQMRRTSTSKMRVELGSILRFPFSPYASSAGM